MYVLLWLLILLVVGLTAFGIYAKLGSYRRENKSLRSKVRAKRELLEKIKKQLHNAPLNDATAELIRREFQNYERKMH